MDENQLISYKNTPSVKKALIFAAVIIIPALVIGISLLLTVKSKVVGSVEADIVKGLIPITVLFKYEVKNNKEDIFFDFGNKNELIHLSDQEGTLSHFFSAPGYFTVRLLSGTTVLDSLIIFTVSDKWVTSLSYTKNSPEYVKNALFYNGSLNDTSKTSFKRSSKGDSIYWRDYRYFNDFNFSLDNTIVETKFKNNSISNGSSDCIDACIWLYGDKGVLEVSLSGKDSYGWTYIQIGEKIIKRKTTNLPKLECDVKKWVNLKIINHRKSYELYINDSLAIKEQFKTDLGLFRGVVYNFVSEGEVSNLKITNSENNNVLLNEEFE